VDNVTLKGETAGATLTISNVHLTSPSPLIFTLTDANNSITDFKIIVKGIDWDGYYQEEAFYLNKGKIQYGKVYFTIVTQVELDSISGTAAASDVVDIGIYDPDIDGYEIWKKLGNKPIKPESENVTTTDAVTTYTRDTDYEMDYINGRIRLLNGGSMAAATAYYIDYTISRVGIDISDLPDDLIKVSRVEYPVDKVPQEFPSFSFYGDLMYIGPPRSGSSQEQMSANEHIAIYYDAKQSPPSANSPGSYPAVLDEVVSIGAGGYVLLTEAQQHEQQAATDMTAMRTELGLTTAIHTLAAAAFAKVPTYLETNGTTDNAVDVLSNITDDIADLRTKIVTAEAAVATALGEVDTTDFGQATVGAEGLLETGDDLINAVTVGARVAENYADYARARVDIAAGRINMALGYAQEAGIRLSNLRSYIEESAGWTAIAQTFLAEGQGQVAEIQAHLMEVQQWAEAVNGDLVLADRFRAEGLSRLNEFHNILRNKAEVRRRTSSIPTRQPA